MDREHFELFYPKIYNYVYYRVLNRQDAEDITGEVFYKAVANAEVYDARRAAYSTWLFAIAHNCVLQFCRNKKPALSLAGFSGASEIPSDDMDPDEAIFAEEDARRLRELLETLPEREREVLALRFWGELSYREIAEHTGLSEKNVSVILSRTLKKLRKLW